jgi:hypothetical protein
MTIAICIAALYVVIVAANCRVFKRLHNNDEEMARMLNEHLALSNRVRYQKTGS